MWGSWHIENKNLSLFHAGDTGYSDDFKLIKKRLGKIDLALIPIGAYSPYWFEGYSHVTPVLHVNNLQTNMESKLQLESMPDQSCQAVFL